jgi:hypothetical protein
VPRALPNYTSPVVITIYESNRDISVCVGICNYFYDISLTSTVNPVNTLIFTAGQTVYISGSGLTGAIVKVGNINCPLLITNDTYLSFKYPSLPAGTYTIDIFAGYGYTTPEIITYTSLYGLSFQGSSGSTNGNIVNYTGNGFTNNIKDQLLNIYFTCGSTISQLKVITATPTYTSFLIPNTTTKMNCTISYTYGNNFIANSNYYSNDNLICKFSINPSISISNTNLIFNVKIE